MLSVMSRRRTSSSSALALHGGLPVRSNPMPARRLFGSEEKAAAMAVFDESIVRASCLLATPTQRCRQSCDIVLLRAVLNSGKWRSVWLQWSS